MPSGKIKQKLDNTIQQRLEIYNNENLQKLTLAILKEFKKEAINNKINLLFLMMPQPEDLDYILQTGNIYYQAFLDRVSEILPCIDLSKFLKDKKEIIYPSKRYSNNYKVTGGHYNKEGNEETAKIINKFIKDKKWLS